MNIAIFTDEKQAKEYAELIHAWLTKNRKDYKADRWCDIEASKDETGLQYYVKVPPDYEELNKKLVAKDKLVLSDKAIIVTKLPDNWKTLK